LAAIEIGGELARAQWPGGTDWRASLGSLRIHATTTAGVPAPTTTLALADTHYRGITDWLGDLTIDELLPGPYSLQIIDPRVAVLGLSIPTTVSFVAQRDSVFRATVTVPTAEEFVLRRCVDARQWIAGDSAMLLGRIVDAAGNPASEAKVTFSVQSKTGEWTELRRTWTTEADGLFQTCVPATDLGGTLRIRVQPLHGDEMNTNAVLSTNLTLLPVRLPASPQE
jgi:hypothetical protein